MDCPICKDAMVVLELDEVEIDHCYSCGGIWLDAGELELLIGQEEKANNLIKSFKDIKDSKEKSRKCPICFKKMQKVIVGDERPILLIDRCVKEHGLWFDAGELQDILKRADLDEDNKVRRLLSEMFGLEG